MARYRHVGGEIAGRPVNIVEQMQMEKEFLTNPIIQRMQRSIPEVEHVSVGRVPRYNKG